MNYNLNCLVGDNGKKLKVKNGEQYHFEPELLLVNILSMYSNMSEEQEFIKNVIKDERSYSYQIFE